MERTLFRTCVLTLPIWIAAFSVDTLPVELAHPPVQTASAPIALLPDNDDPAVAILADHTTAGTMQAYSLYLPQVTSMIPEPLNDLTSGWYLMVDDEHIAARDLPRQYHAFNKYPGNPILRATKPWEGRAIQLYGTVLDGFRMWYSSFNADWRYGQVLYAESRDGITWSKPTLPRATNNAVFGGQTSNLISVMHNPHDIILPYKLAVYQNGAYWGYVSADGINVSPISDTPIWDSGTDVAHFYWNSSEKRYYGAAKENVQINGVRRRATRLLSSNDFLHWIAQPTLLAPDALDDQLSPGAYVHFYGMPLFSLGEQRLGLLWILRARDTSGQTGPVNIQLVSSHDGVNWTRQEGQRSPILDLGPPGAWDAGQVYTASQPIKVGSELWLYYSGCNLEHGSRLPDTVCSIGLATIPYLRLASLYGTGSVTTAPLSPEGDRLTLNYASVQGEIRVELQSEGVAIAGYEAQNCTPLTGDQLNAEVTWIDQAGLPDGPFQVIFLLQNAALYAFSLSD